MTGTASGVAQLLWLVGTVVAGAVFWYTGETRLGIALVVVGLGWMGVGFVVGFVEGFLGAVAGEATEA